MAGGETLVAFSMALANQKTGGTVKWRMKRSSRSRRRREAGRR